MPKPHVPHKVEPIEGEKRRYRVESTSHPGEHYVVDINEEHQADDGTKSYGTCGCKGWSIRKKCTHIDDSRQFHADATDTAVIILPSGRAYFASKTFLASCDQEGFDYWYDELCKRDAKKAD